jgi:hypothetical protein
MDHAVQTAEVDECPEALEAHHGPVPLLPDAQRRPELSGGLLAFSMRRARRETTTRLPASSTPMTRNSSVWPTKIEGSGQYAASIWETGQNARIPPTWTSTPPAFTPTT